jgi:hypothetical protein
MSSFVSTLFNASLVALILSVVYLEFTRWRGQKKVTGLLIIVMALGVYFFLSSETVESKGVTNEFVGIAFSYGAMLLGMISEYVYSRAEGADRKFRINLELLMPIFASPIVFIPVLEITQDMSIGGAFTKPKLMVYLVAFQNGFFWKNFFEERRQRSMEAFAAKLRNLDTRPTAEETPVEAGSGKKAFRATGGLNRG